MRRGRRRRATSGSAHLADASWFALGGVGVAYDGRSWSPVALDVDLDALVDEHDQREAVRS